MTPLPRFTVIFPWLTIVAHGAQILLGDTAGPQGHGAVASESTTCSRVGIDIMKARGNAADAVSLRPQSELITA